MPRPTYQLLSDPEKSYLQGAELDASVRAVITYAGQFGLHLYQDVHDRDRIMFDATDFNAFGGYTATQGIKGKFIARLKRKIHPSSTNSRTTARSAGLCWHARAYGGAVSDH